MRMRKGLLWIAPCLLSLTLIGTGFAVWYFGTATGQLKETENGTIELHKKMDSFFDKLFVWFGSDSFETAFPNGSNSTNTIVQPTLSATQSGVSFTSPMNVRGYFSTDLKTDTANFGNWAFSTDVTLTMNNPFNSLFSISFSKENSTNLSEDTITLAPKGNPTTEYVDFESLNLLVDYKPDAAPMNEEALGKIIAAMNNSDESKKPELTISLSAKVTEKNGGTNA